MTPQCHGMNSAQPRYWLRWFGGARIRVRRSRGRVLGLDFKDSRCGTGVSGFWLGAGIRISMPVKKGRAGQKNPCNLVSNFLATLWAGDVFWESGLQEGYTQGRSWYVEGPIGVYARRHCGSSESSSYHSDDSGDSNNEQCNFNVGIQHCDRIDPLGIRSFPCHIPRPPTKKRPKQLRYPWLELL